MAIIVAREKKELSTRHSRNIPYYVRECIYLQIRERAKLLNVDWSMKSAFCFVKRAKLLTHDWSSGCLATAYSIEKLFFCNNGVSF